jgi:hypothetical protein
MGIVTSSAHGLMERDPVAAGKLRAIGEDVMNDAVKQVEQKVE